MNLESIKSLFRDNERLVFFITMGLSLIALYFSYTTNAILAYNDATAHLNTARRIFDNLTPGIVQIGSVWLPLLHILEMPFVTITFFWETGLAGAIVGMVCFLTASIFLYKLTKCITLDSQTAFIASLVFITNVNLLYLQTTAMFEPLLMATAIGAVYFFTKWARSFILSDLIFASFFTMLATLTRYDGWALFLAGSMFVFIVSVFSKNRNKEGKVFIFIALAGFGIGLWLLYNKLIFGDPLYFARGEYSAAAQQEILYRRGNLPTKENWLLSFETYSLSMIVNIGIVTVITGILGFLVFIKQGLGKLYYLGPLLLTVPFFFNTVSLYLGQSVIWMPMLPPHLQTFFNIRYGILMLPAIAFFAGFLTNRNVFLKLLVGGAVILQSYLFFHPYVLPIFGENIGVVTLADTVSSVNKYTIAASTYLHDHYENGLVLCSSASSDAFIFRSRLPLRSFITEGTGHFWKESLVDPTTYATWLVFFQDRSDRVGRQMPARSDLEKQFNLVYRDQTYQIWKKN